MDSKCFELYLQFIDSLEMTCAAFDDKAIAYGRVIGFLEGMYIFKEIDYITFSDLKIRADKIYYCSKDYII